VNKQYQQSKAFSFLKSLLKFSLLSSLFYSGLALAQGGGGAAGGDSGIGAIATNITGQFQAVGSLIVAIAFLAGIGFIMAAIFKFKQHKDNPTQITLGTPLAMLVIGAFLVFLPSLIGPTGKSIFGGNTTPGGFSGSGVSAIPGGDGK
jgi:intracellular multiplication protein IcmD